MRRRPKLYGPQVQNIVRERISTLLDEADTHFDSHPDISARLVHLARRYSMKYKVRFTSSQRKRVCRRCGSLLVPGKNCRVRTRDGKLVYFCMGCRSHFRHPFKKEQKKRRRQRQTKGKGG